MDVVEHNQKHVCPQCQAVTYCDDCALCMNCGFAAPDVILAQPPAPAPKQRCPECGEASAHGRQCSITLASLLAPVEPLMWVEGKHRDPKTGQPVWTWTSEPVNGVSATIHEETSWQKEITKDGPAAEWTERTVYKYVRPDEAGRREEISRNHKSLEEAQGDAAQRVRSLVRLTGGDNPTRVRHETGVSGGEQIQPPNMPTEFIN